MTAAPIPDPGVLEPGPIEVVPEPDGRLDQLLAEYAIVKPECEEITGRLKAITDAIKTELIELHPGSTHIQVSSPYGDTTLALEAVQQWRLDTDRLKREAPETYVSYAKRTTSWRFGKPRGKR